MAGIFGIGVSGIQAAQMGMLVTQHNITNSNTAGYSRQSVVQTTQIPVGFSTGFIGNGTLVTTVQRSYNQFLTEQVRQSDTDLSSLNTYFNQIQVVDDLLADANAGVSPALQSFFSGLQQVSAAPASLPARQSMVSSAQALVARLQGADQRISDLYGQINEQLVDTVGLINTYGQQIAKLNEKILVAESAVNQPANDLQDQRDQLVTELNKLVKVQTAVDSNGGIQVMVGKGQILVMGTKVNQMTAMRSSEDPSRLAVAMDLGAGAQELPEGIITGGELGGLLDFRRETLDVAVNSLGKVAANLALTFNAQHANGMDLLGNDRTTAGFVADFFIVPDPKVIPSQSGSPDLVATFNAPELTSQTNPGNYFTDLTNSDYRLAYKAGEFTLTRVTDGVAWTGNSVASINTQINDRTDSRGVQGFSLTDDGAPYSDGDSYLIEPTRELAKNIQLNTQISGDVRRIAAASPVRATVGLANQGSMKVNIERVNWDANQSDPGDGLPVTIGISADGQYLTLGDANGPFDQVNMKDGPYKVTMYPDPDPADGIDAYDLTYPEGATSPPLVAGTTYEIWDGNRRIQFTLSGQPTPGDRFTIASNADGGVGVSNGGNILLLGKLQTQKTGDGASSTYQGAYAQMVSDIGNRAREIEVTKDAQQSLVDQASSALNAESGVNLDEEAANLLKFQQLYQAAARSISVGQKLFDELLAIAHG